MTSAVEVIKDAIWPLTEWDGTESNALAASQAAVSALDAAGFVVVPKEPTEAMMRAFQNMTDDNGSCLVAPGYRAMIQAARSTP